MTSQDDDVSAGRHSRKQCITLVRHMAEIANSVVDRVLKVGALALELKWYQALQ